MDDLVQFVRERLGEEVETARTIGNMLVTSGAAKLDIAPEVAERQARARVDAAEAKRSLFEETIRPYLGTAGPTGRIAEQQARLFAAMYADHRGCRQDWLP